MAGDESAANGGIEAAWDADPSSWIDLACDVAGRELTPEEWKEALGDRPYEEVCPPA